MAAATTRRHHDAPPTPSPRSVLGYSHRFGDIMRYFLTLGLWVLFTPATARADVEPGGCAKTPVETCTVENKEQEGTTCDTCSGGPGLADTAENSCSSQFEDTDYEYACQTRGVSFWSEVWCDGPPAEDEASGGCSSIDPQAAWPLFFLLGILLYGQARHKQQKDSAPY